MVARRTADPRSLRSLTAVSLPRSFLARSPRRRYARSANTTPPPAQGVRLPYGELPARVRTWVDGVLGGAVVESVTQPGGFTPGVAARVRTADGRRAFVKAVSAEANPDSPRMHREEAR